MSEKRQQADITKAAVKYRMPGMEEVEVRRDVEFFSDEAGALTMDLYRPPGLEAGERSPAVVLVSGFRDAGFEAVLGCKFKEIASYRSWGRLLAASGMMAVAYTNRDPMVDLDRLLDHLREDGRSLGIDGGRIGLWACSSNVPRALAVLMAGGDAAVRCAALCYGFMFDSEGSTVVADASAQFGFVHPTAGRSAADLPEDLPLLLVRAGQDEFTGLNETIDRFVAGALSHNLPLTLLNLASAPHAFDLFDGNADSHEAIRRILGFLRFHLRG